MSAMLFFFGRLIITWGEDVASNDAITPDADYGVLDEGLKSRLPEVPFVGTSARQN